MRVYDIYSFINKLYPFSLACDFDNVGLLIGDKAATISKTVIALDCTSDVVEFATQNGAELIITHHPVIFAGLKAVTEETAVYKAIKNGISVISAHTNLDIADGGVNDTLCEALGLIDIEKYICEDGFAIRKGTLKTEMSAEELANYSAERLVANARFVDGGKKIKTVAVCSGAGSDFLADAIKSGTDAYISSEIKHNIFIEAAEKQFTVIDLGHFSTEKVIVPKLCKVLSAQFPELEIIPYENEIVKYTKGTL